MIANFFRFSAKDRSLCLDDLQQDNEKPYNLGVYSCQPNVTRSQFFTLTQSGVLRNELSCATIQQRFVLLFSITITFVINKNFCFELNGFSVLK